MRFRNPFWLLISLFTFLLVLQGCGYRWGHGGKISGLDNTITVPYVEGDWDGQYTAALVHELVQSGTITYVSSGGNFRLQVSLQDYEDQNIGFRYDRSNHGKIRSRIVPDETRLRVIAEVAVVETFSDNIVLGPVRLSAEVEFDHDYTSSRNGINIFSMGELVDYDAAYEAAQVPLQRKLARKIVDYINDQW